MNKEIKTRWVAALRSGEYRQGTKTLLTPDGCFCCLGVLCDLYAKHDGIPAKEITNDMATLPYVVSGWAGLGYDPNPHVNTHDGNCEMLAVLNDGGMTFPEIATLIEKSL